VRHELIPYLESRFNPRIRPALARSAALLGDEAELLAVQARDLLAGASRRDGKAVVLSRQALSDAPRAIARLALRAALADLGGRQDVSAVHVNRILELTGSARPSGKRLALPGGREAVCCFEELRLGPRHTPCRPYDYALSVPGQVELPGGAAICATPAPGPQASKGTSAVIVAPEAPLSVRTRRPGDRVRTRGREVSLRSFLMARRVPADARPSLPLVTAGRQVLWVPGLPVETAQAGARRFVQLEFLEAAHSC
jgi:tRNA(Ile)-lysidine synthase